MLVFRNFGGRTSRISPGLGGPIFFQVENCRTTKSRPNRSELRPVLGNSKFCDFSNLAIFILVFLSFGGQASRISPGLDLHNSFQVESCRTTKSRPNRSELRPVGGRWEGAGLGWGGNSSFFQLIVSELYTGAV